MHHQSEVEEENQLKYLDQLIQKALVAYPNDEVFWIEAIQQSWNDDERARQIISSALIALP